MTSAERSARFRAHKAGDHRLCRPEACREAVAPRDVASSVDAMLAALTFEESDPRRVMGVVLARLADAFDRSPSAALAREIRQIVSDVMEDPRSDPTIVDELRARRFARRVDGLIEAAGW